MATKTTKRAPVETTKPTIPGTITLIKESYAFYKTHFRSYWPLFLAVGIDAGLSSFVQGLNKSNSLPFPSGLLLTVIIYAINIYLSVLLILALKNKPKKLIFFDNAAISQTWPFFLVSLSYGLIILGGLVMVLIPGILFAVWYLFASYILLTENLGVGASLKKSKEYVKGHFWVVVGRQFMATFIFLFFYLLLGALLSTIVLPFGNVPDFYLNLISAVLLIFFSGFFNVISLVFDFQLLSHLKSLHKKSA